MKGGLPFGGITMVEVAGENRDSRRRGIFMVRAMVLHVCLAQHERVHGF